MKNNDMVHMWLETQTKSFGGTRVEKRRGSYLGTKSMRNGGRDAPMMAYSYGGKVNTGMTMKLSTSYDISPKGR